MKYGELAYKMELSVVIVSFNVKDYLRQCLASVVKAAKDIRHEIIVVDNNSSDGSSEMVSVEFPEVILIRNKDNLGFSAANNMAIRQSSGENILLLNPDTVVGKDAFRKCLSFMKQHPEAGAIGVKMTDEKGEFLPESKRSLPTPATAFFKLSGLAHLFPCSALLNRYHLPSVKSCETAKADVIAGAFMFLRKKALLKTGLLDEDFFMYGEDIDLSYRLLKAGYSNYYYPDVEIIHYKGKSTPRTGFSDIHHFYRAMRIYSAKRNKENFNPLYFIIIPAIYLREGLALFKRCMVNLMNNNSLD
jgi:GT2 family glycosyltransferase